MTELWVFGFVLYCFWFVWFGLVFFVVVFVVVGVVLKETFSLPALFFDPWQTSSGPPKPEC